MADLELRLFRKAGIDRDSLGDDCLEGSWGYQDWQSYVPDEVKGLWKELPIAARLVAYLCARDEMFRQSGQE